MCWEASSSSLESQVIDNCLGWGLAEGAPGMEAAGKSPLFIAFADQAQAAWPLMFFRACVLDVYLVRKTVGPGSPPSPAGLPRMREGAGGS